MDARRSKENSSSTSGGCLVSATGVKTPAYTLKGEVSGGLRMCERSGGATDEEGGGATGGGGGGVATGDGRHGAGSLGCRSHEGEC